MPNVPNKTQTIRNYADIDIDIDTDKDKDKDKDTDKDKDKDKDTDKDTERESAERGNIVLQSQSDNNHVVSISRNDINYTLERYTDVFKKEPNQEKLSEIMMEWKRDGEVFHVGENWRNELLLVMKGV